ncbi:MAG: carboxypeptidase-like regulatory domain-containing protein [Marinilabiliales bacterium]|nr:carboxypeptidase-like regulatory domain-containing protein [Marinilabiliales bacterium]
MSQRSTFLFLLLFLIACLKVAAQEPLSRSITLKMDTATVEAFLEKLVNDNDLYFSYNPDLLPDGKKNFSFSGTPLGEVLKRVLPDSVFHVTLIDRQLIITKSEPKPFRIAGRVVEKDGKSPILMATISVEGESIGTMTNREGFFDLNLPARFHDRHLIFSSVGYKQLSMTLPDLLANPLIRLYTETIHLREVEVKPTDPKSILTEFRNRIRENYSEEPLLMETFYRETARQDGNYVGVWEAVMEILKSPYQYNDPDRVRIIKGRKADLNRKPKEVLLKVQGGPLGVNMLDIVKNPETFLSPEYEYLYKYSFEHPTLINGRLTWIIGFERIVESDFPCFNGKLMIDAECFALVGAEYSYDKKSLKINGDTFIQREPFGFDTRPEMVEYAVQYRLYQDKWHFYSGHSDILFRVKQKRKFKTDYRNVTDVLVTRQFPFPRRARFGPDGLFHEHDIFSEQINGYDEDFWGNYNVIRPDDDLRKAIKEANYTD